MPRPRAVRLSIPVQPRIAVAIDLLNARAREGADDKSGRVGRAEYISDFVETAIVERFEEAFGCSLSGFVARHPELHAQ